MKRFLITLLALAMLAALVGCTSSKDKPEPNGGKDAAAASPTPAAGGQLVKLTREPIDKQDDAKLPSAGDKKEGECLRWEAFTSGGSSSLPNIKQEIFTSYKALEEAYGSRAEAYKQGESASVFVVAVTCTVNTGGYTFGVNKAYVNDGVVYIDLSKTAPAPGSFVTQAFVNHTVLIEFDASLYKMGMRCEITVNGAAQFSGDKM